MEIAYRHSEKIHNTRAAEIVVPYILELTSCKSVLDVGCGIGTWLNVFLNKFGVSDIVGIDGHNVDVSKLMIPAERFFARDLREPFDLQRQFDLLLCLEVAEHLPAAAADGFVDTLCRHSRTIAFSAAIPGQGGQHHLNEQWPDYWSQKFARNGYRQLDPIRPLVWRNADVDVWYRQNLYLFTNDESLAVPSRPFGVPAEIHPDLWMERMHELHRLQQEVNRFEKGGAGIVRSFRAFAHALTNWVRK